MVDQRDDRMVSNCSGNGGGGGINDEGGSGGGGGGGEDIEEIEGESGC